MGHGCFPTISHQTFAKSVLFTIFTIHQFIKSVYFTTIMFIYLGNFALFSLQKWFWGYFAKGIWQNFAYCSTKIIRFMYSCSIKSLHKIKILCLLCMFALANYFFCGTFHSKMSNSGLHVMPSMFMFNNKCVLLQRTPIWFVWCIFESNILLFCSQPRIITCLMYFVGVQI